MGLSQLAHLPFAELAYIEQLTRIVQDVLGQAVVGVYLFGSAASSAYQPGGTASDLDIAAVVTKPLSRDIYDVLVARLNHSHLPCPARKLEFVLYAKDAVNPATRFPNFELNLNTGPREYHVTFNFGEEAGHWFLLDIAMARELGVKIWGGEGSELKDIFPKPKREWVIDGTAESIRWHKEALVNQTDVGTAVKEREKKRQLVDAVLNACRGWRWTMTGNWGSKVEGGEWAVGLKDLPPVKQALALRNTSNGSLGKQEVVAFLEFVEGQVRAEGNNGNV